MGWQITAAEFSTVDSYLENSIQAIYDDLVESDSGIAVTVAENGTKSLTYSSTYGDATFKVYSEKEDQLTSAKKEFAKLSKKTTKEKLEKVDELIATAKEKIEKVYIDLVKAKKEAALDAVEEQFTNTYKIYKAFETEEQRDALIADATASVEACTTLEGLNKVFASNYSYLASDKTVKNDGVGSFYKLNTAQVDIIKEVKDGLAGINEHLLTIESDSKDEIALANQETLIDALAEYGVEVSELPSSIAQKYIDQALALREAPEYNSSKSKYQLAIDGKKAVEDSVNNLYTELYKGIVDSFKSEIDALSSSVASENLKTTIKSIIETTASNWKSNLTDGEKDGSDSALKNTSLLCSYLGLAAITEGDYKQYLTSSYKENSLVGTIEKALSENSNVTTAIQNERIKNVLATYKLKWANELAAVKEADSDYADAITLVKDSGVYKAKVENVFVGEGDYSGKTVSNPVFGNGDTSSTKVERKKNGNIYYSAEAMYETLVDGKTWDSEWKENTGTVSETVTNNYYNGVFSVKHESNFKTALVAKQWAETVDGSISKSYSTFMSSVVTSERNLVTNLFGSDGVYVTSATVGKAFDNAVYLLPSYQYGIKVTLSELNKYTQSALKSTDALKELDSKVKVFVGTAAVDTTAATGKQLEDAGFTTDFVKSSYSVFNDKVLSSSNEDSVFAKCLSGEMSKDDVAEFAEDNFESIYKKDTLGYAKKALENAQTSIKTLTYNGKVTALQAKKLETALTYINAMFNDEKGCFDLSAFLAELSDGSLVWYVNDSSFNITVSEDKSDFVKLLEAMGYTCSKKSTYLEVKVGTESTAKSDYTISKSDEFSKAVLDFAKEYAGIED